MLFGLGVSQDTHTFFDYFWMSIEDAITFCGNDSQNQRHLQGTHFFHRMMIGGEASLEAWNFPFQQSRHHTLETKTSNIHIFANIQRCRKNIGR